MLALCLSFLAGENKREDTHTHIYTYRGKRASKKKGENKERHDEKAKRFFSVVNK
jgi:hypothetical protein